MRIVPFNRTSLESKPCQTYMGRDCAVAFNRTSLESKLTLKSPCVNPVTLLIEPVWNRNVIDVLSLIWFRTLLIEPVWNRNCIGYRLRGIVVYLLIEPVWNRNFFACIVYRLPLAKSFNRTSLESKLVQALEHR